MTNLKQRPKTRLNIAKLYSNKYGISTMFDNNATLASQISAFPSVNQKDFQLLFKERHKLPFLYSDSLQTAIWTNLHKTLPFIFFFNKSPSSYRRLSRTFSLCCFNNRTKISQLSPALFMPWLISKAHQKQKVHRILLRSIFSTLYKKGGWSI